MTIKAGSRWMSAVCETEIVVIRAPKAPGTIECGGAPTLAIGSSRPAGASLPADRAGGTLLGKRYADETSGLEVLCTKAGRGALSFQGRPLVLLATTPLPSSD